MGYTTDFEGGFTITPALTEEHMEYLAQFNKTRRMKRNPQLTAQRPDEFREAVKLPVGPEGAYFVGEGGVMGQGAGFDVVDINRPPAGQPGLWCQWVPEDEETLVWDGGEKFYYYIEWLEYLISHFFQPWGYTLNGEAEWQGEEMLDRGMIVVKDNKVGTRRVKYTEVEYEDTEWY